MNTTALNLKQLESDAAKLGFTFEIRERNVHMQGKSAGDAIKLFALQGCDVVKNGANHWIVRDQSGEYVGYVGSLPGQDYALAATSCIH